MGSRTALHMLGPDIASVHLPRGEGEMERLIREFDWAATSLGPMSSWPQSLRTSIDIALQSPIPIVVLWGQDGIRIYNDAYSVFAGKRHPELLGSKVHEGWTELADFNVDVVRTCMNGQTLTYRDQHLVLSRNGRPEDVWLDLTYSPILDENRNPAGVFAVLMETTPRIQAQMDLARRDEQSRLAREQLAEEVEKRTRQLASVWRVARDLFCICSLDGYYQSVNPAWTDALGYQQEELVGMAYAALIHPDDLERAGAEFAQFEASGRIEIDLRMRCKNGEYRWFNWNGVAEGDVFYAAGRDINERKELEEQLRQSQKMEAVGQLTGGIAHDFNNLLTGIIGSLDLMQTRIAQGRTENVERYAKAAIVSANRAASLTHRLLAFARRQPLDPKPINANQLIASMEDLLRRTIGESIELELVAAGGLWLTLCDPNQLENALLNLVINARDAMPKGGKLTIETTNSHLDNSYVAAQRDVNPGQYVTLCISDTGTGMPPEVIARAFDPFFTTKPMGQGTGLGLSMVYGFAKQSEGHVRIYSEIDRGTTIRIYLPRYRGKVDVDSLNPTLPIPRSEQGETVLVVEDEPVVRGLIVDVLKDFGYQPLEAPDGFAGLKIIESGQHIDLLITDIGLPGMNGRDLADRTRVHRPDLKILFITGYAENAAIASGFLEPGMEMITKPFAIDVLGKRIRDMIGQG